MSYGTAFDLVLLKHKNEYFLRTTTTCFLRFREMLGATFLDEANLLLMSAL